jgi:hypothetical protein
MRQSRRELEKKMAKNPEWVELWANGRPSGTYKVLTHVRCVFLLTKYSYFCLLHSLVLKDCFIGLNSAMLLLYTIGIAPASVCYAALRRNMITHITLCYITPPFSTFLITFSHCIITPLLSFFTSSLHITRCAYVTALTYVR